MQEASRGCATAMAFVSAASGTGMGGWHLLQPVDERKGTQEPGADGEAACRSQLCPELAISCRTTRSLTLVVLVVIFVANQACRALPFYLVDFNDGATVEGAMNVALGFRSGMYGFFATMGFTIPFTVGSLAAGVIADKADRMQISAIAGLLWSSCTLCMAGAASYSVLMGLRMLLGLSQSITNPAALSLIADLFPEARATMNSVFGLGIYLGGGVASLGAALDEQLGWRYACAAFGLGSMVVSLLAFIPADPRTEARAYEHSQPVPRRDTESGAPGSVPSRIVAALQHMALGFPAAMGTVCHRTAEATSSKAARWMLLASALRFCAGFGILVWLPSAVHTRFPDRSADFSVYNSVIKAFAGGVSSLAGGLISDALRSRGLGDCVGALFCAASSLVSAPLWHVVLCDGLSFEVSMGCLLAEYLTAESWLGPAIATLQGAVPADRRGAAQGVFSSLTALGNALPACLGLLAAEDLAHGLQVSVTVCYVASAACFAVAGLHLHRHPVPETPFLGA
mmetsp:Transcript_102235/g.305199  ORF Transcript_102235/g.305199 Transcript_102235/m.305199 type:complete len:513 (-) Transcript_102235:61-1599(-)